MNKIQPLDQIIEIVASALNQTAKVRKSFESFFIATMILILTIYGKLKFLSMARHGDSCESRFRQNFKKKFDWCAFNSDMLLAAEGRRVAIALDHSYLRKSGKKTPGLGRYWSGCAGMVKRGLKAVVAEFKCGDKPIRKILFSTDLAMTASEIFLLYHSRFQIEFLYRDAKQNTGLEHWQSTDADRLSFGYNASLSAVNVARKTADNIYEATGRKLSVASVKKVLHNASQYQHVKKYIEGQKSDNTKNNYVLTDEIPPNLLFFGVRDSA